MPDALAPQVPVILDVLAAAGLATAGADGHEADDVIGTLCAAETTDPVEVVSGDRDLMQVVRDEPTPVRLVYVGRGLAKAEMLGPPEVAAKYGVPARPGRRGLRGAGDAARRPVGRAAGRAGHRREDGGDAGRPVRRRGTELRAAVDDRADTRLSPPVRSKLAAAGPYLAVVEPVVRVALDAPVRMDRPDAVPGQPGGPGAAGGAGAAVGPGRDGGAAGRGAGGRGDALAAG